MQRTRRRHPSLFLTLVAPEHMLVSLKRVVQSAFMILGALRRSVGLRFTWFGQSLDSQSISVCSAASCLFDRSRE